MSCFNVNRLLSLECNTWQMGVFQFVMNAPQGAAIEDLKGKLSFILMWKLLLDSRNPSPNWKVINPGIKSIRNGHDECRISSSSIFNACLGQCLAPLPCMFYMGIYISMTFFMVCCGWRMEIKKRANGITSIDAHPKCITVPIFLWHKVPRLDLMVVIQMVSSCHPHISHKYVPFYLHVKSQRGGCV